MNTKKILVWLAISVVAGLIVHRMMHSPGKQVDDELRAAGAAQPMPDPGNYPVIA